MVTFSVLMPAYNHERFVAEAVESVLGQTFKDLELIVIDDCSRDGTPDVLRKYAAADPRVKAYFHQRNLGISRTLNEALDLARGEFVAVINSDDRWRRDKLERQWEILRRDENLVVWTEGELIDGDGRSMGMTFTGYYGAAKKRKSGYLLEELVEKNFILHSSIAVKRSIMEAIRYDEKLKYNNDYKLFMDLAAGYDYFFIPEKLVGYRIHGANAVSRDEETWERDYERLFRYLLERYGSRLGRTSRSRLYHFRCRLYEKRNMRSNAMRQLYQAIRLDPENVALRYKALNLADGFFRGEHFWVLDARDGDKGVPGKEPGGRGTPPSRGEVGRSSKGAEENFQRGLQLCLKGRLAEAASFLKQAIREQEECPGAWTNLGVIMSMQGHRDDALLCFESALRMSPGHAHAWYNRSIVLDRGGMLEEAAAGFGRAAEYLERKRGIGLSPPEVQMLATAWMNRGVCLAGLGEYEQARGCMERALRVDPRNAQAWFDLGLCKELCNMPGEAARHYEKAFSLDPRMVRALLRKGLCRRRQGLWREAARCFDRLLSLDPRNDEAWMEKGTCFHRQGDVEKALSCYDRALSFNPENAEAWYRRGRLLAAEGDFGAALSSFERVTAFDPGDVDVLVEMGRLFLEKGWFGKARESFTRALEEEPESADAWYGLGLVCEREGEHGKALDCYGKVIEVQPGHAGAWNERGNVLSALGRYGEARESYLKALDIEPGLVESWFNLAEVDEMLGRREEATFALKQFVAKAPPAYSAFVKEARRKLGGAAGKAMQGRISSLAPRSRG